MIPSVGHTHEDIDQAFSLMEDRLLDNDAVTWNYLHKQLRKVYNSRVLVMEMVNMINRSGLCSKQRCLSHGSGFSHYHYFRFTFGTFDRNPMVQCHVKMNFGDDGKPRSCENSRKSFFSSVRYILPTPPIVTRASDD